MTKNQKISCSSRGQIDDSAYVARKVNEICKEAKVAGKNLTHGYVFAQLNDVLLGTKWSYLSKCVPNCTNPGSLIKFLYNVQLCVLGMSDNTKIKVQWPPKAVTVELKDSERRKIEHIPIYF